MTERDTDPAPAPTLDLRTIRAGDRGELVQAWQYFLAGRGQYAGDCDGVCGPRTVAGTRLFQLENALAPDGVAGPRTLGTALAKGWSVLPFDAGKDGSEYPPRPTGLAPLTAEQRHATFGRIVAEASPMAGNPEAIRITNGWHRIVMVDAPLLSGIHRAPKRVALHEAAAEPFTALVKAWGEAGLLKRIATWDGSWAPRFIRGSTSVLSSHAWGTAFDLNAAWNGLGVEPAYVGRPGSVRELVEIANANGWWWGGHYARRKDGMHFELVRP